MKSTIPVIPLEILQSAAKKTEIRATFVEKDYWAISLLKGS